MNTLIQKLARNEVLLGLFCCSYSTQVAEALAHSGYDYLLFDAEHTPSSLPHLHAQLLALAGSGTQAVIRVAGLDLASFKLYADLGVDGLMLPNVHDAATAERAASYLRYPPLGIRGVAGSVRALRYGRQAVRDADTAPRPALIVQAESTAGVDRAHDIASVDGVDAVFFGPNDLAADMGLLGQPSHPRVVERIEQGIAAVRRAGKPAGILASEADCPRYAAAGARLVAAGSDLGLLVKSADGLAARLRPALGAQSSTQLQRDPS
ncbi:5-keto-4-deoxy-D-glucarate aldolase [Pigmentiphaga humi]|uniref:5-keto-4-deoxy-D-glucarate aldolase n=1 Tax=Pigmentiphaga humi TaxID=2478468 RepID=A0A3P4B622_9BURK|nr:aldolase/citrate lyase family protein [Pigmentiphaga humi]VCU71763.1 5-keto-4-deoxy-D-glucarate aldolase [Pigmentiphaga humi]